MLPLMAAAGVSSLVVELFSRADVPAVQPMPRDMSLEIGLKISGKVDKLMGKIQVGGVRVRWGAMGLLLQNSPQERRVTGKVEMCENVLAPALHNADRDTRDTTLHENDRRQPATVSFR